MLTTTCRISINTIFISTRPHGEIVTKERFTRELISNTIPVVPPEAFAFLTLYVTRWSTGERVRVRWTLIMEFV